MRNAELLTSYLVELDRRGWDLDAFIRQHPDISVALREMLSAAERLRRVSRPAPSEAFRQRSRRRLAAAIARPSPQRRWNRLGAAWRPYRPLIAPVAAGLLIVFGLGGVWSASATALPNSFLYPAKLAIERAELITALSPASRAEVHLAIAHERLLEAAEEKQQGDLATVQELIDGSDAEVAQAQAVVQTYHPPTAVATAVASSAAQVADERNLVATNAIARSSATPTPKVSATPDGGSKQSANGNPAPNSPPQARTDSGSHATSPRGDENSPGGQDGHQPPGKSNGQDSPAHRPQGDGSDQVSPAAQADHLVHLLVTQAIRGDPASEQTAARYVSLVRSQRSGGTDWRSMLSNHRALIVQGIPDSPSATRPVLESVLQELNRQLGPADSGPVPRDGGGKNDGSAIGSPLALASPMTPGHSAASSETTSGAEPRQVPGRGVTASADHHSASAKLPFARTPGPSNGSDKSPHH